MNESQQPEEIQIKNARSLKTLVRAIAISQGRFTLILVQCNYADLRSQILKQLQSQNLGDVREIFLPQSANKLDAIIAAEVGEDRPNAVMVLGLESVSAIDDLLSVTNQARDKFRYNFSFPLVWWVNDDLLTKLIRLAPDLYSWAGVPIKFDSTTNQLIELLQQQAEQLFAQVLDPHQYRFIEQDNFNCQRIELELALEELQSRGEYLPELEASQRFILGREAYLNNDMDKSRRLYIQSLLFWQSKTQKSPGSILIESDHQKLLERQAGLLCYLGLWWRRYAVLHRAKETKAYQKARIYYRRCLRKLEQANRLDLVAKFINACGETLKQLQAWDELEQIANKAVDLYQIYPHPLKLGYAYGLLAEIAIAKSHWNEAKEYAETALETNLKEQPSTPLVKGGRGDLNTPLSQEGRGDLDPDLSWLQSHYESWYRLLLAKSQRYLEQLSPAESNLRIARKKCNIPYNPQLYIQILEELRCVHFKQHHYLEAFNIKSEKNSLEQQYGFRAFIGAGRLESQRQVINPAFVSVGTPEAENQENKQFKLGKIAQEIEASGRKQDVDKLVAKISRDDKKLIVVHGLSGVGKSSLITAGLIPALHQEVTIHSRTPLPVIVRNYNDWAQEVGSCLAAAIKQVKDIDLAAIPDKVEGIIEQLQLNIKRNFLTILIFDQFEEFFFNCPNPLERKKFWEFLHLCLDRIDIGYVKVILSLREDYLHLLLEADRLTTLQITQNDILNKEIRYYFGNFSPAQAKQVIKDLTARSFYMEPGLIDALVADLAGELKEVRPIELQVVGMQLQTEGISRLQQYQEIGNKQKLIERFLNNVIQDCGQENQRVAELVLYFLTDENNTRPPKTKAELAAALDQEADKLELVLEILVKSGLVSLIPQSPADRYQLIHDYLVAFIRQQRSADLVAELEKEREARKASEAKLDEVLKEQKEQLRKANRQKMLKALNFSDGLIASAESEFAVNKGQLQPLLKVIKAGKQLQAIKAAVSIPHEKQLEIIGRLNSIFAAMKEHNSLQGHKSAVTSVSFSPDAKTIASASLDKTVKLWRTDGSLITTFIGHENTITSVSFSPDGQTIASASYDKTVKLWRTDGSLITTFIGHGDTVWSVSFSPDGQTIASASYDKTVKLWRTDGRLITTFKGHGDTVTSVSFSPDGQTIASASLDKTVKLWRTDGRLITTFKGHENAITSVSLSLDGKTIASASLDKTVKLWRTDGSLITTFIGHGDTVMSVSFSPDAKTIASASWDNTVKLWRTDGRLITTFKGHENAITSVSFSPDSQTIASASRDKAVKLWRTDGSLITTFIGHRDTVTSVSFSPDGQTIASASWEYTVKLWRTDGSLITTFIGHEAAVWSVSFSPDGQTIASASDDNTVKLWRTDGSLITTFIGHESAVTSVSFSPDGQTIASASWEYTVKLWRIDGSLITTFIGHEAAVWSVSFSPDGQTIASASSDNRVKLWRTDGRLITTFKGHENTITSVSFSPDGQTIASASYDKTVKLWRTDGWLITTFIGHGDTVWSVSFSPDGQTIASASSDKTVKLWRTDGRLITTFVGHEDAVWSVSFSPNGKTIASASFDKTVKLWNLDLDDLLVRGCSWIRDYLKTNPNVSEEDRRMCDSTF